MSALLVRSEKGRIRKILISASCPQNTDCKNTDGSFYCKCSDGLMADTAGKCIDVDECAVRVSCFLDLTCGRHFSFLGSKSGPYN